MKKFFCFLLLLLMVTSVSPEDDQDDDGKILDKIMSDVMREMNDKGTLQGSQVQPADVQLLKKLISGMPVEDANDLDSQNTSCSENSSSSETTSEGIGSSESSSEESSELSGRKGSGGKAAKGSGSKAAKGSGSKAAKGSGIKAAKAASARDNEAPRHKSHGEGVTLKAYMDEDAIYQSDQSDENSESEQQDFATSFEDDSDEYCYFKDTNPYMGFSTMTPYNVTSLLTPNKVAPKSCKPRKMWLLIQPGSSSAERFDMVRYYGELLKLWNSMNESQGTLCPQDSALLQNWNPKDLDIGREGTLTTGGKAVIRGIASRFKTAFPMLMEEGVIGKPYGNIKISVAPNRPSKMSAQTFSKVLFGRVGKLVYDRRLGVTKCHKHMRQVLMQPMEKKFYYNFAKGKLMKELIERVRRRLGLRMTLSRVRSMYNACRYQNILYPEKPSPWCVAFTKRDLQILEYWEDLRLLFDYGYMNQISYIPVCVLAKAMLKTFQETAVCGNDTQNDVNVNFVTTEKFVQFITFFNLFRDPNLPTQNRINETRNWRTSKFAGYGSNFAFFLSSCKNGQWWVSAALNESPLQIIGCKSTLGCPFEVFNSLFRLHNCSPQKVCGLDKENLYSHLLHLYYSSHDWM